MDLPDWSDFQG